MKKILPFILLFLCHLSVQENKMDSLITLINNSDVPIEK